MKISQGHWLTHRKANGIGCQRFPRLTPWAFVSVWTGRKCSENRPGQWQKQKQMKLSLVQNSLRELSLPLLFLSQRFPASLNVVFTPEAVKMWVTSLPNPRPISNFNLLKPMLHLHPAFYMSLLFRIINCLGDYSILAWRIVVWYYFGRDRDQANIFHCRYHLNPHKMIKLPITTAFRTKCLFAWMQVHFI